MKLRLADRVFSQWVRKRDKYTCQKCLTVYPGPVQGLDCAHYFSRRGESTRFYPDNCITFCVGCHMWFHQNPKEHELFVIGWLGMEDYEKLLLRHRQVIKKDDKAVVAHYRGLLANKLERGEV
jgi:hypothetical protein